MRRRQFITLLGGAAAAWPLAARAQQPDRARRIGILQNLPEHDPVASVHVSAFLKELQRSGLLHTENVVQQLYKMFTTEDISEKIAELITPKGIKIPIQVIFQTIESLHEACPTNTGDWYFTGNYPTPGGNRVVNKAFINYMEGKNVRGY